MVKNKKGGSKHKKGARKHLANNNVTRKLRKAKEEGEIYARVIAVSGGGHAKILCADKKERTLVIRGKFRGRNKRNNMIKLDSIVLAGLRSVSMGEVVMKKKKEKADLIYVYDQYDMDELKQVPEVYNILNTKAKDEADDDLFDRSGGGENIKLEIDNETDTKNQDTTLETVEDFDWDDI
tara:strand:- start:20818 stop:21357 length:540 start_codon:yes stop_codon:yes gene_type:complete